MADQEDLQRTIDIVLQATNNVAPGLTQAEKDLQAFQERMRKMREEESRAASKGALRDLKSMLGEDSAFGLLAKTAAGTGAFAGLSFATAQINKMVQGAVQLRNEFHAGTITADQMLEKLAGQIPIYGQLFQAGRGIRELITGETLEAERLKQEHEATNKILEARLSLQRIGQEQQQRHLDTVRKLRQEIELLSAPPEQRDYRRSRQQAENSQADVRSSLAANIAAINKRAQDATASVSGELGVNRDRLDSLRAEFGGFGLDAGIDRQIREAEQRQQQLTAALAKIEADRTKAINDARARANEEGRLAAHRQLSQEAEQAREHQEKMLKEQQEADVKRQEAMRKDFEARTKWHEDFYKGAEQRQREFIRDRDNAQKAMEAALMSIGLLGTEPSTSDGPRRRFNFRGTAEAETGGTLTGFAASARERASLMGSDPERQERDKDRRDEQKRHEELKKKFDEIADRLIRGLTGQSGATPLN